MTKQRPTGLPSTVAIGIFLLISLFFTVLLLSQNVQEALASFGTSSALPEDSGEMGMVFLLVAGIGVAAMLLAVAFLALAAGITAAIPLLFSIRNLRAEDRVIRGINVGYTAAFSVLLLLILIKIVLILSGIG